MSIVTGTLNGVNIIALPSDAIPRVLAPKSIEWDPHELVATNESPFTAQTQAYDWMQSYWAGTVSFGPMNRWSWDAWNAFIRACRGPLNYFLIGDPKAKRPKGNPVGNPVVNGSSQTGYIVATQGWVESARNLFLPGDYIQIGYRLYTLTDAVDADSSGHASLPIWPPLRDQPADGTAIVTHGCRGLFRLQAGTGNKSSVNVGAYGLSALQIREAI